MEAAEYIEAINTLRDQLNMRRGWGGRVSRQLHIDRREVYNVAHGRTRNPEVLQALISEAEKGPDPSIELMSNFINKAS
ncbi:hypothetical protein I2I11_03995 [Pontibacter sp. 172403-2]|uniref:hypothetical protein n=1 Tax=Pontibacter rufus TaxID=2791028 RepID=UPI0018AFFA50|nr:hypothetical protein [Pontibacter sp. 172403-2]MBF9252446.1 hypothetical protein [Pontibacter sp. 172403-2]